MNRLDSKVQTAARSILPTTWLKVAAAIILAAILVGCADPEEALEDVRPVWVQLSSVRLAGADAARFSGVVHARYEIPLSFQVGGRILNRHVDAGQKVAAGALLFELDPRDFDHAVRVAQADVDSARAELDVAEAETRRNRNLLEKEFISPQDFERFDLAEQSALQRLNAFLARLELARTSREYATLSARDDGLVVELTAEPGQVVAAGQTIGLLATGTGPDGRPQYEVEVFLPESLSIAETGRLVSDDETIATLSLREFAGAADAQSRTRRVRYTVVSSEHPLRLGSVVKVALNRSTSNSSDRPEFDVPVGAINERGDGARVWIVVDDQARPIPVEVLGISDDRARIVAELKPDARVIAAGTHLMQPGLRVRELDR